MTITIAALAFFAGLFLGASEPKQEAPGTVIEAGEWIELHPAGSVWHHTKDGKVKKLERPGE